MKTNWDEWAYNLKKDISWEPKSVDTNLLDHLLPVFASIPLVYNNESKISVTKTVQEMPNIIKTPNGEIDRKTVFNMLYCIYSINRSVFIKKMINNPRLGSLTPIPMYAFKLHHNIPYEKWDYKDSTMRIFLGKYLEPILDVRRGNIIIPIMSDGEILANRKEALTAKRGIKAGTVNPVTSHYCSITSLKCNADDGESEEEDGIQKFTLPKVIIQMKLQLWLANASIRKPGTMILDPQNWDATPKPLDTSVPQTEDFFDNYISSLEKPKVKSSDLPW